MGHFSIGSIIYIVIGVLVANSYGYLSDFSTLPNIISASLSIALWPLLFLGIDFTTIIIPKVN